MSAEIEQPKTKRCCGCYTRFPATLDFFPTRGVDKTHPNGGLKSRCRSCIRGGARTGVTHTVSRTPGAPVYVPGPKPCVACHGMPWRVAGPRCPYCQLEYAPEPRPEFVLRRFDRCG